MKQPLVSVIIPTYNRIEFLPHAIKSVLEQEYENVEVIVVDDGSTDGTQEYLLALPTIFYYLLTEHKGQCTARNFGLSEAHGKYILMLDDDDALWPGIIEAHVKFLEENKKIDLVFGDMMLSNTYVMNNYMVRKAKDFKPDIRKGNKIDFNMKEVLLENLKKPFNPKESILFLYVPDTDYLHISTGTAMFRKNRVRYDPAIEKQWNCSADVDFWGQLIMAGLQFHYLPGLALEVRIHSKNLTNQAGVETQARYEVRKYIWDKLRKQAKNEK